MVLWDKRIKSDISIRYIYRYKEHSAVYLVAFNKNTENEILTRLAKT